MFWDSRAAEKGSRLVWWPKAGVGWQPRRLTWLERQVAACCLCYAGGMHSLWSRLFEDLNECSWSCPGRASAPRLPDPLPTVLLSACGEWRLHTNSTSVVHSSCPAHPLNPRSLGEAPPSPLVANPTTPSNSPFSQRIHGQRKESLLTRISDNKCTFFGLKRNPSRVIFCFWAWIILPWDRTCSWLPTSVKCPWLLGREIKQWRAGIRS